MTTETFNFKTVADQLDSHILQLNPRDFFLEAYFKSKICQQAELNYRPEK